MATTGQGSAGGAMAVHVADAGQGGASDAEDPIETVHRRLYDLKWHVPRGDRLTPKQWLTELVAAGEQCSCGDVQAAAHAGEGETSSLVRFLKSDDVETVELASAAVALLAGQGTYRTTLTVAGIGVRITQRGFAGSGDTLGNQVWPSALRLSELCGQARDEISGKRVVELGCGPGLPGLLCAHLGALSVLLTDFEDAVLDIARSNVTANPDTCAVTAVARLDWTGDVAAFVRDHGVFDVVLAADCVYNSEHAAAVAQVIAALMAPGEETVAVVVLGDRKGRRGVEQFESASTDLNLHVTRKHETEQQSEWVLRRCVDGIPRETPTTCTWENTQPPQTQ
jgi:predicted nicotinamide N-methyase